MSARLFRAFPGVLVAVSLAVAQEALPQKGGAPPIAEVRYSDGSCLRMTILQDRLEVMTKYGKLTIPMEDIRRVDVGPRLSLDTEQQIRRSIHLLSSQGYEEREGARHDLLRAGAVAYPFLKKAAQDTDGEVAERVAHLLQRIADKHPREPLRVRDEDVIHTEKFPVVGRITEPTLRAQSPFFPKVSDVKFSDICTIEVECELSVDASHYGSAWLNSRIVVGPSQRVVIRSEGQVDLWLQSPGLYLTTPKGYTIAGKGETHMAGALLGKIGKTGKEFVIGERYAGVPNAEGPLCLRIVPSSWESPSKGTYQVRVRRSHAALTPP